MRELEVYAQDVRDTAASIMNLDLVITVDTITAHLAGALGKPVWILLPREADWRWMIGRDDSPWYPAARLFRNQSDADWSAVISQAKQALAEVSDRLRFTRTG
jgi:ADP-heptose:LPS heptosyltransferase